MTITYFLEGYEDKPIRVGGVFLQETDWLTEAGDFVYKDSQSSRQYLLERDGQGESRLIELKEGSTLLSIENFIRKHRVRTHEP